jgi:hypothetical protein
MIRAKLSGNRSLVAGKWPGRVVVRIPEFIFQKKNKNPGIPGQAVTIRISCAFF